MVCTKNVEVKATTGYLSNNARPLKSDTPPPEKPFTTKKEISAGEIQKNKAKGFSGGASGRVRPQALGLSLHGSAAITLEIGSRFFVECSQIREKLQTVARTGDRALLLRYNL